MRLHKGQIAKQVAGQSQPYDPNEAAHHIEQGELAAGHVGHARHKGDKGADKRHEAGQDDGDAAEFFVKSVGLVKALAAEKPRVFPLEHPGAEIAADRVVGLVAQNSGHQQQAHHQGQAHQTRAAHGADDEQQRVARQKRHDHNAGFHKNDEKQQGIDPGPILSDKGLQVAVDVEDEINKLQKDVHAPIIPAGIRPQGQPPTNNQNCCKP